MEPIRPDDDELRASRSDKSQEQTPRKASGKPDKRAKSAARGPSGALFFIVVLLLVGAGAIGWYQQNERILLMESQLEEADYWARQSKLALARFEGELSETGEDLQQAGQSIEQRLSAQSKRLDGADSEIRKLWGVANDRNKARLNDHESRLEALSESVSSAAAKREALASTLSELESATASKIGALQSELGEKLSSQGERLGNQQATLEKMQSTLASVDEQIDSRLIRFQREQKLTIDGLEGRIAALEKATQALSGSELSVIRSELSSLKPTVAAIDASRAQLTSRLVRLSEEVSQLRARVGGQQ